MSSYPYSYEELLERIMNLKSKDEQHKKISIPPLQVTKQNRMTIISNFLVYSDKLNRQIDHIASYFKTETGLNNSINSQNQLIIQGIFNESKCESIMKNYIKDFVMCKQCRTIESKLIKENGVTFLECHRCASKTSLGKI